MLLVTKFHKPPVRDDIVSRHDLLKQLSAGVHRKLTLVSAPAGYGKSTLISQWLDTLDRPGAWISLDAGDNNPSQFLRYVAAGLQQISSDIGTGIFDGPTNIPGEAAVRLINDVITVGKPCVGVLDDFHSIVDDEVLALLRLMIERQPPHVHLVIITRHDPPLPLARYRASGQLTEIRARDLMFSTAETAKLLNTGYSTTLTDDEVETLVRRTEGWVVGLQLAALSLCQQSNPSAFIHAFAGADRHVMDYLVDEVLSQQPEATRQFMLATAVLDQLCGSLCDTVLGAGAEEESQHLLEQLEQRNLFVVPLDNHREWYRYHHLFADMLRHRLQREMPEQVPLLYDRASRWFEQHDHINEAIHYAQAAGNSDRVCALIGGHILNTILQSEYHQARSWLNRLPSSLISQRAVLCVAEAWISLRELSPTRAHEFMDRAETLIAEDQEAADSDQTTQVMGHIAALRAIVARTDGRSPDEQQKLLHQALDRVPSDNSALQGMLNLRLGLTYMDLGYEGKADQILQQIIRSGDAESNQGYVYMAVYVRTIIAYLQGRLHDVADMCEEALQTGAGRYSTPWQKSAVHAFAHIALGLVLLEWDDLDSALFHLREGIELNAANGLAELQVKAEYALGRLLLAQGVPPPPMNLHRLSGGILPSLTAFANALQAHLWLMTATRDGASKHLLDRAVQWASKQSLRPVEGIDRDWQIKRQLIYIRILLADKRQLPTRPSLIQMASYLDDLQAAYKAQGWVDRVIEILIVSALVQDALHDSAATQQALTSALLLAEHPGYVQIFLDEGEVIVPLLYECVGTGDASAAYAGYLLAQYSTRQPNLSSVQTDSLVESLTPREIEVLTLIADGYTNREIGQTLSIALGTVKRHTANINGKLNAHNRTEAVAVARSLKILQ